MAGLSQVEAELGKHFTTHLSAVNIDITPVEAKALWQDTGRAHRGRSSRRLGL